MRCVIKKLTGLLDCLYTKTNQVGDWVGVLPLRLILAIEFGASGFEKLHGENWFADIKENFPFPFSIVPVDISWGMATWFEILGAFALVLGLGTRFVSISLLILTFVAMYAVHLPAEVHSLADIVNGYVITGNEEGTSGNFKLPLLYAVMLLPFILNGAGKLSIDSWIKHRFQCR